MMAQPLLRPRFVEWRGNDGIKVGGLVVKTIGMETRCNFPVSDKSFSKLVSDKAWRPEKCGVFFRVASIYPQSGLW